MTTFNTKPSRDPDIDPRPHVKHSAKDLLAHMPDEDRDSYAAFVKELHADTGVREDFISRITAINQDLQSLRRLYTLTFSTDASPSTVLVGVLHFFASRLPFKPNSSAFHLLESLTLPSDPSLADASTLAVFNRLLHRGQVPETPTTPADCAPRLIDLVVREAAKSLRDELAYWERHLNRAKGRTPPPIADLELLRQVPLQDLLPPAAPRLHQTLHRLQTLCPFHQEKTPSFVIFTTDNHFHCYGCQAHGDVITFVQKLHSLDFKRACEYLAQYT